mgnify:CR=1 FL=1
MKNVTTVVTISMEGKFTDFGKANEFTNELQKLVTKYQGELNGVNLQTKTRG